MATAPARAPEAARAPREDGDDPRMLAAQFEMVQRELRRLQAQLDDVQEALAQTQQAAGTLRSLAGMQGEQEAMLPVGAGVHVHARLDPAKAVLIPLGAGYATEDTPQGAADLLEKRVSQLTQAFQQASTEAERLARTAGNINEKLLSLQAGEA